MIEVTPEVVREELSYDPDTSIFRWLRPSKRRRVGDVAGSFRNEYRRIGIHGKIFSEHRLAYAYMTGAWPEDCIDHINGIRHDNRWVNLRPATRLQNQGNQRRAHRNNESSGLMGVSRLKNNRGRWMARICVLGKDVYLGRFDTAEEAHAAYLAKKREHHEYCMI